MKAIGLKRLTVRLLSHNKKWEESFNFESKKLQSLFAHIEHIGSTAIQSIVAKPIIDIDVGLFSMSESRKYIKPLKNLGYELRPSSSSKNHLFFVKGKENKRTHYLHLIKYKGKIWNNDIFFRNYLNKYNKSAKSYEKLKIKLGKKFINDRTQYTKEKKEFIKKIIRKRIK